jgi:hypothetical protein
MRTSWGLVESFPQRGDGRHAQVIADLFTARRFDAEP